MSLESAFDKLDFLKPVQRARLATIAIQEIVQKGRVIFNEGDPSEFFYVLLSGEVELKNKVHQEFISPDNFFGSEVPCGIEQYLFTAVAKNQSKLLKIKKNILYDTIDQLDLQKFQKQFLQNFIGTFYAKDFLVFKKDPVGSLFAQADRFWINSTGWVLSAFVPFLVYWLLSQTTMNHQSMIFLSVLSAWSVIASFRLLSDYVATMVTIFLLIGGGVVKTKVILAGFSSGNFIIALSLLGLSSVLISSGVMYRILLKILNFFKPSYWRDNIILLSIGGWLTLGVPTFLLRMNMMKVFYQDTLRIRGIPDGTIQAQAMGFSAYCGAGIFSQSILSASMMHFVLLGLFWGQYASRFDWWGWFFASLGPLIILLFGYLFILFFLFERHAKVSKSNENKVYLNDILKILGPPSSTERASLICMVAAVISLATVSLHDVGPDVICLLILLFLFTFQFMNDKGFQTRIKWDFLIFICGLSGIAFAASDVGLINWLEGNTKWMGEYLNHHFFELATFMIAFTFVMQFVLPRDVNINILSIMFIPLFQKNGVSPWFAIFIINTVGRVWFFEYQEPEYALFTKQTKYFSQKTAKGIKKARMYMNIFYLLSVYVAIFYWKWIGLL